MFYFLFSFLSHLIQAVYEPHCRHVTAQHTSDCFPNEIFDNSIPPPPPSSFATPASNAIDQGRAYESCELARELRYRHNVPNDQIADFVCIALYSSNLATSAKGQNSYGLFQISSDYWCSDNGVPGKQCNIECSKFEDSDITGEFTTVNTIASHFLSLIHMSIHHLLPFLWHFQWMFQTQTIINAHAIFIILISDYMAMDFQLGPIGKDTVPMENHRQ